MRKCKENCTISIQGEQIIYYQVIWYILIRIETISKVTNVRHMYIFENF